MENRLCEIRRARGLAIRGLTARSGVSATTISAVEKWDYQPAPETRQRLADALGVEVREIWPVFNVEEPDALAAA